MGISSLEMLDNINKHFDKVKLDNNLNLKLVDYYRFNKPRVHIDDAKVNQQMIVLQRDKKQNLAILKFTVHKDNIDINYIQPVTGKKNLPKKWVDLLMSHFLLGSFNVLEKDNSKRVTCYFINKMKSIVNNYNKNPNYHNYYTKEQAKNILEFYKFFQNSYFNNRCELYFNKPKVKNLYRIYIENKKNNTPRIKRIIRRFLKFRRKRPI